MGNTAYGVFSVKGVRGSPKGLIFHNRLFEQKVSSSWGGLCLDRGNQVRTSFVIDFLSEPFNIEVLRMNGLPYDAQPPRLGNSAKVNPWRIDLSGKLV